MDELRESEELDRAVETTRAVFVRALRSGDARSASSVYADTARLLAPSAELIKGREAIESFWRAGLAAGVSDVEQVALELEARGCVACEIGRYAFRLRPAEGEAVLESGKYLLVHHRQADGAWRRAVEMFNPDAPPARTGGTLRVIDAGVTNCSKTETSHGAAHREGGSR
jgi:ketosteroid isomerase-like protein